MIIKPTFSSNGIIQRSLAGLYSPRIGQEYYKQKTIFNTQVLLSLGMSSEAVDNVIFSVIISAALNSFAL